MSSLGFAPCPVFELRPSSWLQRAFALGLTLALAALLLAQLHWSIKSVVFVVMTCVALRALQDHAWRTAASAVVQIRRRLDGRWELIRRDGKRVVGFLAGSSYIHPTLAVVVVRDGYRVWRVPVAKDALDLDGHRRLRLYLAWAPKE